MKIRSCPTRLTVSTASATDDAVATTSMCGATSASDVRSSAADNGSSSMIMAFMTCKITKKTVRCKNRTVFLLRTPKCESFLV